MNSCFMTRKLTLGGGHHSLFVSGWYARMKVQKRSETYFLGIESGYKNDVAVR